jgi:hypothetical protein
MDIVMVHTIEIFVLYVGIIAAIQECSSGPCHGKESPDMSTYIRTHWVTHLRVPCLLNMSSILDHRDGRLKKWFEEVSEWFHYITDGFKRVQNPTGYI